MSRGRKGINFPRRAARCHLRDSLAMGYYMWSYNISAVTLAVSGRSHRKHTELSTHFGPHSSNTLPASCIHRLHIMTTGHRAGITSTSQVRSRKIGRFKHFTQIPQLINGKARMQTPVYLIAERNSQCPHLRKNFMAAGQGQDEGRPPLLS